MKPGTRFHVLFVCVENSCRSQMAEGFARRHGAGFIEAFSAGSRPTDKVNPRAVEFMREKSIDIDSRRPKGLDDLPPGPWAAVVTMGCGDACPHLSSERRLDWNLPDPKSLSDDDFRKVRDEIETRVKALLEDLAQEKSL